MSGCLAQTFPDHAWVQGRKQASESVDFEIDGNRNNHGGQRLHCDDHIQMYVVDTTRTEERSWSRFNEFGITFGSIRRRRVRELIQYVYTSK